MLGSVAVSIRNADERLAQPLDTAAGRLCDVQLVGKSDVAAYESVRAARRIDLDDVISDGNGTIADHAHGVADSGKRTADNVDTVGRVNSVVCSHEGEVAVEGQGIVGEQADRDAVAVRHIVAALDSKRIEREDTEGIIAVLIEA